jgi:hypothetical protein
VRDPLVPLNFLVDGRGFASPARFIAILRNRVCAGAAKVAYSLAIEFLASAEHRKAHQSVRSIKMFM